jgi:hypothetical protein
MLNFEITSFLKNLKLNLFNQEAYEFNEIKIDIFNLLRDRKTRVVKSDILMLVLTTI